METGIKPRKLSDYLHNHPELQEEVERVREELNDVVEGKLVKNCMDEMDKDHQRALEFYLRHNHIAYREEIELRHGGSKDGPPIQHQSVDVMIDPNDLPLEMRKQLLEIYRKKQTEQKALPPPQLGK